MFEQFCERRGYDEAFFERLEAPFPTPLLGLDTMREALHELRSESIVILPDFDMDGIMAGTIFMAGLSELGFKVSLYTPDASEGYGFAASDIQKIRMRYPEARAILTCDVGSTSYEGIEAAREAGFDVLISDHHALGEQSLESLGVRAFVNPHLAPDLGADEGRCGAFVACRIVEDYAKHFASPKTQDRLRWLRAFAGIGTVSDSMPMLYDNRRMVRDSIMVMRYLYERQTVPFRDSSGPFQQALGGLVVLMAPYRERGTLKRAMDVDEDFFGFYLAPMFNAVKRLGLSSQVAFDVFFSENPGAAVRTLMEHNETRKSLVDQSLSMMENQPQPYAPYIYLSSAPEGLLGLLATSLLNNNPRPVLVLRQEGSAYKGSGRSPGYYDFLTRTAAVGFFKAGHEQAFGVAFEDEAAIRDYLTFIEQDLHTLLPTLPPEQLAGVSYDIDFDLVHSRFDFNGAQELAAKLHALKPFGPMFEEPKLRFRLPASGLNLRTMGQAGQHLKIFLDGGMPLLAFGQGASFREHQSQRSTLDFIGTFSTNFWQDREELQVIGQFHFEDGSATRR